MAAQGVHSIGAKNIKNRKEHIATICNMRNMYSTQSNPSPTFLIDTLLFQGSICQLRGVEISILQAEVAALWAIYSTFRFSEVQKSSVEHVEMSALVQTLCSLDTHCGSHMKQILSRQ